MFKKVSSVFFTLTILVVSASCSEPIIISPDAVLPNGAEYSGELKNGKFHGRGVLKSPTGDFYRGEFANGLMHGDGEFETRFGKKYQGYFTEGSATGDFVVTDTENNARYEGDLKDWMMHGVGKYTFPKWDYQGGFRNDRYHGYGTIKYKNGDQYKGNFENGYYSGQATLKRKNGDQYIGAFKRGKMDGEGRYEYENGAVYEGGFRKGEYHGQGKYTKGETVYEGEFVDGSMEGSGRYVDYDGTTYTGEIKAWYAHGKGEMQSAEGDRWLGDFENGSLIGEGKLHFASGGRYEGEFSYNEPDGKGTLKLDDGSVYEGEFSYGQYHGEGTLTSVGEDGSKQVRSGQWKNGELIVNAVTGESIYDQVEIALEKHQHLLQSALDDLPSGKNGHADIYLLSVGGDGSQSVFRREVEFVNAQLQNRYGSDRTHRVSLINHHDSAAEYPMATRRSIRAAVEKISEVIDPENDVLFLYMSSHGSASHEFFLNHDSMTLPDLSAVELGKILEATRIKWKVIMVSACYSGGFIPVLESKTTMVLTAADANSRSFGCSEESEMTYFGRALFKETLAKDSLIEFPAAFQKASKLITEWEDEKELDSSNPQLSAPRAIVEKLASLSQ